ncbi:hypothetical protein VTO73DRAFT_12858 [Trametes versicolor]
MDTKSNCKRGGHDHGEMHAATQPSIASSSAQKWFCNYEGCGYECGLSRGYAQRHFIGKHLQEAIFVCMQCGDAYAWSQALLRHQNYKHPYRTDEEKATQKILNRRAKDAVLVRYPNMVLEPNESRDIPRIPRWDSDLAWEESPAIAPLSVPVRPLLHGAFALQQSTREHMDHPSPKPHPYLR